MKKVLMVLLGIALVFSMTGVVAGAGELTEKDVEVVSVQKTFTDDEIQSLNGNPMTQVLYGVTGERYTLKYPSIVDFALAAENAEQSARIIETKLDLTTLVLNPYRIIYINVTSDYGFNMTLSNNPEKAIPYSVIAERYEGAAYFDGELTVKGGTEGAAAGTEYPVLMAYTGDHANDPTTTTKLTFMLERIDAAPETGSYADNLRFTVSVKDGSRPVAEEGTA